MKTAKIDDQAVNLNERQILGNLAFVKRQLANSRPATRRKAERYRFAETVTAAGYEHD